MPTAKEHLSKDHQQQEHLLRGLAEALEVGAPPHELRRRWSLFERSLLSHVEAEENVLFPVFAQAHRNEMLALRAEHSGIRWAAIELSVSIELHTVKKAAIDHLLDLLREHGAHEHRTLHVWLDEDEGISSRRAILEMVARRERAGDQLDEAAE
jgi:iron-sulfur cluster repair protein YtfE (RIC family)